MLLDKKNILDDYSKLYRGVYQYFRRNRFSREDAQDHTQEAFARYLKTDTARVRSPKAYLFRIARNLTVEISTNTPLEPLATEPFYPFAPQEQLLEIRQKRNRLTKILQELSPRSRQVFLLHRTQDLTYQDIADQLDISIKTVEHHIAKALAHIKKSYQLIAD